MSSQLNLRRFISRNCRGPVTTMSARDTSLPDAQCGLSEQSQIQSRVHGERRKRNRLSDRCHSRLRDWILENRDVPYPDTDEKVMI